MEGSDNEGEIEGTNEDGGPSEKEAEEVEHQEPADKDPDEPSDEHGEGEGSEDEEADPEEPGMWEETFKSHHDSKPYGNVIMWGGASSK